MACSPQYALICKQDTLTTEQMRVKHTEMLNASFFRYACMPVEHAHLGVQPTMFDAAPRTHMFADGFRSSMLITAQKSGAMAWKSICNTAKAYKTGIQLHWMLSLKAQRTLQVIKSRIAGSMSILQLLLKMA